MAAKIIAKDLRAAAEVGNEVAMKKLLEGEFDVVARCVNDQDMDTDMTALLIAASEGHDGCIRLLLEARGDLNIVAEEAGGRGALHMAAYMGNAATVALLIDSRADITLRDSEGQTARDVASERAKHEENPREAEVFAAVLKSFDGRA